MTIDYDKLMNWPFEETRQTISPKDVMLYALGVGIGADPVDENQLRFVYEKDLFEEKLQSSICVRGNRIS